MSILDRYISRQFLFNFVMLFVVVTGLYVLLDLIVNFDEFAQAVQREEAQTLAQRLSDTAGRAWAFYWPRMFLLYNYMVGLLPIGAAGFTLAALIRNRELVAMLAGGLSLHRVALPLIVITFIANLVLIANQEFVLPRLASRLIEGHAQVKKRGKSIKLHFTPDGNGSLFTAAGFDPHTETMVDVSIHRRMPVREGVFGRAVERITAAQADWNDERGGWELTGGYSVSESTDSQNLVVREPQEVEFIASDLDPPTVLLRERERFRELLSIRQLGQLIDKPHLVDVRDLLRIRQARFSLIVVNMLILLMGLPYFLLRSPGPLLLPAVRAAAMTVPAWAGGFIMHQLSPEAMPPAAVAWLPVAIFLPIAFYMMETVET